MLKILRYFLSVLTMLFAIYGLITSNFQFNHFMIFFLGLTMLVMGLEEFRKERKANGWLFVVVFLFLLFVSIKGFLLN
ncbi:DUF3953 domain-containing protein [Neobacillus niacini]|uniref:DUF3953 domain-containing protein n=1 Tax=Neobacillus niacini TaxID=86668 RepID=UPI002FFE1220